MKKKPKEALFSKYFERDEKLIFASRAGNFNAGSELLQRYFELRYKIGNCVSPTIMKLLDSWEFNHAFFDAYNSVCRSYKHGRGATLRTYFSRVFKHSLISEASSNQVFQRLHVLSFDEEIHSLEGNEYTLADIVPAGADAYNDVVYYVDYMDSLERFTNKDFGLNEMDKTIVKLKAEGLAYTEIAEALSIPTSQARRRFLKFYNAVLRTIKTSSMDKIKKDFEKIL